MSSDNQGVVPPSATDKAQLAKDPSASGGVFEGQVVDSNPFNQTCQVMAKGLGADPFTCYWAASLLSNLVGVRSGVCPEPGSDVLVFRPSGLSNGYIVGCTSTKPATQLDVKNIFYQRLANEGARSSKTAEQHYGNYAEKNVGMPFNNPQSGTPIDLFQGDWVHMNENAMVLAMLKTMLVLKASDLAMIQMSMLDDMVRIVSHNFQHFSSFGEFNVVNDEGELTMVLEGTHRENEGMGVKTGDAFKTVAENEAAGQSAVAPLGRTNVDAVGLWRLKMFVGYLGDMVNFFVLQPKDAYGMLSSALPDAGMFQFHVGTDGKMTARSISEVALEKAPRIQVPKKKAEPFDPAGDSQGGSYDPAINKVPFLWNDDKHPYIKILQLRDYCAYLNNFTNLARLQNHKGDWTTPEQKNAPLPDETYDKTSTENFQEVFATIRILYDGSIVFLDSTGNSVFMSRGQVKFSGREDVWIEAGRNINLLAGNDIIQRARKSVDISATDNDVRIKAQGNLMAAAVDGGILMECQSNGVTDKNKSFSSDIGKGGEEAVIKGIVLKASKSTISVLAQTVDLQAWKDMFIRVVKRVKGKLSPAGTIYFQALSMFNWAELWLAKTAGAVLTLGGGQAKVTGSLYVSNAVYATQGGVKQGGEAKWSGDSNFPEIRDEESDPLAKGYLTEDKNDADQGLDGLVFHFRKDADYRLPEGFEMYQTTSQQALAQAGESDLWTEEPSVIGKVSYYPYPGTAVMTGEKLVTFDEQNLASLLTGVGKNSNEVSNAVSNGVKILKTNGNYIVKKLE